MITEDLEPFDVDERPERYVERLLAEGGFNRQCVCGQPILAAVCHLGRGRRYTLTCAAWHEVQVVRSAEFVAARKACIKAEAVA